MLAGAGAVARLRAVSRFWRQLQLRVAGRLLCSGGDDAGAQLLGLRALEQVDAGLERHFVGSDVFSEPQSLIFAALDAGRGFPRSQPELPLGHELDDLLAQDGVGVGEARERAVEKALAQAGERPRAGILQRRRPVPVDVARAHRLVEQRFRLENGDDPSAQRRARAGVPGPQVDHLEPAVGSGVGQGHVSVAGPDLLLGRVLGLLGLGPDLSVVGRVELGAQKTILELASDAHPRQPLLRLVAQLPPRLLGAPDQGARIQSGRCASGARPLGHLFPGWTMVFPGWTSVGPLGPRVEHHQRQARRIRHVGALLGEAGDRQRGTALELGLHQLGECGADLRVLVQ